MKRRSMLFVPGNVPRMMLNADVLGADSLIFDIEDAVSINEKDAARIMIKNYLKYFRPHNVEIIIRVNSIHTPHFLKDIQCIVPLHPDVIMPTKINSADDIKYIDTAIQEEEKKNNMEIESIKLMPLLETALGIENAYQIGLASKRIVSLYLGAEDLTADMRARRTKEGGEIHYSRQRIIMAARAAGVEVHDTPFTDIDDDEGLRRDAQMARDMGFSGKAVISPRHIDIVNEIFTPTQAEIEYAKDVIAAMEEAVALGKGAVSLNGKMIDAPILQRARHVLSMTEPSGYGGGIIHE